MQCAVQYSSRVRKEVVVGVENLTARYSVDLGLWIVSEPESESGGVLRSGKVLGEVVVGWEDSCTVQNSSRPS